MPALDDAASRGGRPSVDGRSGHGRSAVDPGGAVHSRARLRTAADQRRIARAHVAPRSSRASRPRSAGQSTRRSARPPPAGSGTAARQQCPAEADRHAGRVPFTRVHDARVSPLHRPDARRVSQGSRPHCGSRVGSSPRTSKRRRPLRECAEGHARGVSRCDRRRSGQSLSLPLIASVVSRAGSRAAVVRSRSRARCQPGISRDSLSSRALGSYHHPRSRDGPGR